MLANLVWADVGLNVTDNADETGTLAALTAFDALGQYTVTLTYDLAWDPVTPEVEGSAHIVGRNEWLIDPTDPLRDGFILR